MAFSRNSSFTLIELLIVIGVLAVLATVAVLALNPTELVKQARDSNRIADLATINKALSVYQSSGQTNLGTLNTVYISIPDSTTTCANLGLPTLPSGWSYACVSSSTLRDSDGTGWIPVNFNLVSYGSPLEKLPVDPINTTSTGNCYTYVMGGSWKLAARFESAKYTAQAGKDGGPDPSIYEEGTDVNLAPFVGGLVGYWKFDESAGVLSDSSGYGNNGTQSGGVTYAIPGLKGSALSFDGVDDYVSFSNNGALADVADGNSKPFTLMAWVNMQSGGTHLQFILARNGYHIGLVFGAQTTFSFALYNAAGQSSLAQSLGNSYSQWYHVAGVWDGAGMTLYTNGQAKNTNSMTGPLRDVGNIIFVGGYANSVDYYSKAIIDNVRIYNRGLTSSEIQTIYNAGE
ncbi:MAG: prepilin-type N-terminal cleavage/methylation domain-containing protein [Candidatus Wolfebacteria bacterium]|nr:prepilin-type N-terminal cleavage/methylation domain-containing protein [Candidatus Wolfebacteria bacterium]